jgi:hypothetical protein
MEKAEIVARVGDALLAGARDSAAELLRREWPFLAVRRTVRRHSPRSAIRVFLRDGFVDRYSGGRLVFPPMLRILSRALPDEFPYHPNWRTDDTHRAYWELSATLDHLVPISRGGVDEESNWVTTSMLHNGAKMNWTLEELGWTLYPPGDRRSWDGLLGCFLACADAHPELLADATLRRWRSAARAELA